MKEPATQRNGRKPGPKGKGVFRIVEFTNTGGSTAYRVTGWMPDGQRIRQNFSEHAAAVARLQQLEIQTANLESAARPVVTRLTPEQTAEAEVAYRELNGKPLLEAVRFYNSNYREPITKATVDEAWRIFIVECQSRNLRPLSITNLTSKTKELRLKYGNHLMSEVGTEILRELIFKPSRGPKARDNYRRALHSFFAWSARQGYAANNPVAAITPIKADRHEPAILTPVEASELLEAAMRYKEGVLVPYVSLGLFAGLRPTELSRLAWNRIDLRAKTITIGSEIAKMRAKRIVEMSINLREWLNPFSVTAAPIVGPNFRRDFDAIKKLAGWGGRIGSQRNEKKLKPWQQDIMRHSAISYHLARYKHEGKTAAWAGNSPDIVQRHYKGLVRPADAKRYWGILPPTNRKAWQAHTKGTVR